MHIELKRWRLYGVTATRDNIRRRRHRRRGEGSSAPADVMQNASATAI